MSTFKSKTGDTVLQNIREIQESARKDLQNGAVTQSYGGDVETSIRLLNEALATELVCALRYKHDAIMADGIDSRPVAGEFEQHYNEEREHAEKVAQRIKQLGGNPNMNPEGLLSRSHSEFSEGDTLIGMIQNNLIAERVAIDIYRELVRYFSDKDPTSRRMLEEILAVEEEHADDLATLLTPARIGKQKMTA